MLVHLNSDSSNCFFLKDIFENDLISEEKKKNISIYDIAAISGMIKSVCEKRFKLI